MKAEVYNEIAQVPKADWDALASQFSRTQSRDFWAVVEKSGLNDFKYRYAIFRDESGKPAALAAFYTVTTDIAIFAPAFLRKALALVRRLFPSFLKIRMLECGTPMTLTSPPFIMRKDVSLEDAVEALDKLLLGLAQAEGHFLIVVRDFETNAEGYCSHFRARGYHLVHGLPNTYLGIRWRTADDYLASMKSYYRSKVLKHMKRNELAQMRHEVVENFDDKAELLCAQWMTVYNHAAEFQREKLTPEFYRQFSRQMGAASKAIYFYSSERLVGHALLMLDGETLRWLYFGREAAQNDSLYLYVAQAVIKTAIGLGVKQLEMGLTTYPIKTDMGAQLMPMKMALRARSRFINFFVGFGYSILNRPPKIENKNVFKSRERIER
ncbi:MAG: GNAT family N-acetyltransferase [Alphaproteobacteria bacterium]|nr:GNAT family N-acetyltransferase [Alphaproteobacteria bacterium]